MLRDLSLPELRQYRPVVEEPPDFDEFWASELATAAAQDTEPVFTAVPTQIQHADVVDVTFPGYAGDPIKGWLLLPHVSPPDRALVVEYVGYGGGRGDPFEWLTWSCAGHPHLIMDTRGQGGGWRSADTPDPSDP
ncbi:MAG: cephalosporin-C deacetylase, partial [Streptosporangiaceae bacterium]|nr:cephalosporin-C deacetylase [Streptosporangiaceae bacterium]